MTTRFVVSVIAALAIAACGGSSPEATSTAPARAPAPRPSAPRPPRSLFVRLGGKPAIEAVVGEFAARLAADPRVKFRFANSDVPRVSSDLVDFVCLATGGPCTYRGREMGTLHASMQVTEEEWDATVEALVGALDKFKVGAPERNELLSAVASTKKDIVAPPSETPPPEELARIDAASADLTSFGARAEMLGAAFNALRRGQRSHAEQLFSMVEEAVGAQQVAAIAPLFRAGGPPRVTTPLRQLPEDTAPQPKGAVGSSDEDGASPKAARSSLGGRLRLSGRAAKEAFGVVMLTPSKGRSRKRTPKHRVIEQRGREFAPHLMAVPVGSTVAFPNFDGIYHNVFSRSEARPFDLGIFKNGQSREVTFDREGIVRIACNL
ncbi:MAG TPA: hypothetical protein VEL05_05735, partial [Candidatus Acidoferrum sp.]|nr:hypothetical protein [Candidatus Acidoferrum sp.]